MKYLLIIIVLVFSLWIGGVISFTQNKLESISRYQITLECQKIAATATNRGWSYNDCLKELKGSLRKTTVIPV